MMKMERIAATEGPGLAVNHPGIVTMEYQETLVSERAVFMLGREQLVLR